MPDHILVKQTSSDHTAEDPDYDYTLECPAPSGCGGWSECDEKHEVDGKNANEGPYDWCEEDDPWCGYDEFDFHGVTHTWHSGHGWTVPYVGCVVLASDWYEPDGAEILPPGRYVVRDHWEDTDVELVLVGPAVTE